jgi:hypothetical protein
MKDKKDDRRFTIQLNKHNPLHLRAASVLNRLKPRGKAHYLVAAILYYESCGAPDIDGTELLDEKTIDEKTIEAIVSRVLLEVGELRASESGHSVHVKVSHEERPTSEIINIDDDFESLDEERLNAIAEAASCIEMLKKR